MTRVARGSHHEQISPSRDHRAGVSPQRDDSDFNVYLNRLMKCSTSPKAIESGKTSRLFYDSNAECKIGNRAQLPTPAWDDPDA
jgi:hypothetical protein